MSVDDLIENLLCVLNIDEDFMLLFCEMQTTSRESLVGIEKVLQRIIKFVHKWCVSWGRLLSSKDAGMTLTSVSGDVFITLELRPVVKNRRGIQIVGVTRLLGKVCHVIRLKVDPVIVGL